MNRNDLKIEIDINGPLLTQSSEPGDFGMDIIVARTAQDLPYIPGTLLLGKLDQAWQEIQDAMDDKSFAPDMKKWLGRRSENNFPFRKQLYCPDLLLRKDQMPTTEYIHHRIAIDKVRGAAGKQQLVAMESPFQQGKCYTFTGIITYFAPAGEGAEIEHYIQTSLRWLTQLGAMRTIGYGRINNITVTRSITPIPAPQTSGSRSPEKIPMKITPKFPFCLAGSPVADNLFESTEIIPGAAILGSIMTTWNFLDGSQAGSADNIKDHPRKELKDNFNRLRITHAFPSETINVRPVVYPKSLVKIKIHKKNTEMYDVALGEKPCLIKKKVPSFAIDWKETTDVATDFGWTPVTRELRIRTGIDPDLLRSSENELFSLEQVVPNRHCWYAELDLSGIPEKERDAVFSQLRSLVDCGVMGLGKTKTPFSIEFLLPANRVVAKQPSSLQPINSRQWVITLQSDTLLGSPQDLDESSGRQELRKMYEEAWSELSDEHLKLVRYRYFCSQRLAGGLWRRRTMQKGHLYRPWLLTKEGSVFVLEAGDTSSVQDAAKLVETWFRHGLPLHGAVLDYYGMESDPAKWWQQCPYTPQNGYGEIAVNLAVHTARRPEEFEEIETLDEEETGHGA